MDQERRVTRPKRGIKRLTVKGIKSLIHEQSIEFAPLTLLSGSNSAGKSSMMQALLLLKQTLDASYDAGPILLNGPHAKFAAANQLLSRLSPNEGADRFSVALSLENGEQLTTIYQLRDRQLHLSEMTHESRRGTQRFSEELGARAIAEMFPEELRAVIAQSGRESDASVRRKGCFYWASVPVGRGSHTIESSPAEPFAQEIQQIIHLPGLRGNPERSYPVASVSGSFPGGFHLYVASVIAQWQESGNLLALKAVGEDLAYLGLGYGLYADTSHETEVRLRVGRVRNEDDDKVNIVDVGLGVSQTLPILIALHIAQRGQIVFIEEPEIHLHPRAQVRLTELLVREAKRGVKIVIETHSPLMLLGFQTAVARGRVQPSEVALYWFERDPENGATTITRAELDELGRFGAWPVDFGDVSLQAQEEYMEAGEAVDRSSGS